MKRQADGGGPGGDPRGAFDASGGWDADGWEAVGPQPSGYASAEAEAGGVELLEDRTIRISGGGHGRRFGGSVPGAVVGSLVVAALALGAALGPLAPDPSSDTGTHGGIAVADPTQKPDTGVEQDADKTATPDSEPVKTAGPDAYPVKTEAPATPDKAAPTEAPAPDAAALELGLRIDGSSIVVEWSACSTDNFAYYKVIRSKDEYAKWPLGSGDTLAAYAEDQGLTHFVDKAVDGGRTYTYKVVALRSWEGGLEVACRSDNKSIATPAATPKPEPKPEPKPQPGGGGAGMSLTVTIKEGHPFLDWSACVGVDFDYYKVVRSGDSMVTWPKSGDDSMVTAVGADGETKAWDGDAPGGKTIYYAVFCVRSTEAGYVSVGASAVVSVVTPEIAPAPAPVALGFEANLSSEGVVLHWEASASDHFSFYKVVRSLTNANPSYLPGTDGSQVIGVIESSGNTQLVDSAIAPGQTIYYRVQAIGYWYGQKILLGQTAVIAVTVP